MNPKLRLRIYESLNKVIEDACEDELWKECIHESLATQMANACEAVFDAAQEAQRYARDECGV